MDNTFSIDETDQAIAQVFKHKCCLNSYDNEKSLFYFYDENLFCRWKLKLRFQLWQNSIDSLSNNSKFFLDLAMKVG